MQGGGINTLYPHGNVLEAGWDLVAAVQAALAVLNWYKNYPKEDVPPEEIWHHEERLEEWFAAVEERRRHPEMQKIPEDDEPGERNEYLEELLKSRR